MALTECPECREQVSTTASSCPHCGYTLRPSREGGSEPEFSEWRQRHRTLYWTIGIVSVIAGIVCLFFSWPFGLFLLLVVPVVMALNVWACGSTKP